MKFAVGGNIVVVDQGEANLCWAAVSAVMKSWYSSVDLSMEEAVREIGEYDGVDFVSIFQAGDSLNGKEIDAWIQASNFWPLPGKWRDAGEWEALLRDHGPLVVVFDAGFGSDGMAHLVVMISIAGDESLDGTFIEYINPDGGKIEGPVSLRDFSDLISSQDAVAINFSVLHFP